MSRDIICQTWEEPQILAQSRILNLHFKIRPRGNVPKQGRNTHSLSLMSVTISPCSAHSLPSSTAGTRDLLVEISGTEQARAMGWEGLPPSSTAFQETPPVPSVLPITQRVLYRQVNAVLVLKLCTDLTLDPQNCCFLSHFKSQHLTHSLLIVKSQIYVERMTFSVPFYLLWGGGVETGQLAHSWT